MTDEISKLSVNIYADGANLLEMVELAKQLYIKGLTTNPTLMRAAGIKNYSIFARSVLEQITQKPVSFEVFCDDIDEMFTQAKEIASWGENVFVKIPITNTKGNSTAPTIKKLSDLGVKVNVTAVMTIKQVEQIYSSLNPEVLSNISVFAGRIADTGRDPIPIIKECLDIIAQNASCKLIWASPRELFNIFQAESVGCHIITVTQDLIKKLSKIGYDLEILSLDTVKMFYDDARNSGFKIT